MTARNQDELLDHARRVIRDLRAKLAAAEAQIRPEPIAIVGMAFRFPGAGSDPEQLWKMFAEGRDAVGPLPADRWSSGQGGGDSKLAEAITTSRAGYLDGVRRFDAAFFDITPREAVRMDPQQRIFLETAWHALEDAGLPREKIAGSETGVFVGIHNHSSEYRALQFENPETLDAYSATGTAHDMIAGRLAYWLDLHGPAVAVNTACSSSLAAVHLACRSLRAGDCTTAIAAGVNLLLSEESMVAASQLQLLSPDGHCWTFDARANGMGRGEGCGVVVLKKLSAAQEAGDRVLAVIRGSAMNQDGRTNGLTAPNGLAQRRVLEHALAEAGVAPGEVGYIETHGTGTRLGDPIEVEAIAAVFGSATRALPCVLGAVKANLGHLEGGAGIAGLIKAVMVLRRRWIPPVANLEALNPHLTVEGTGLEIPRTGRTWTGERPRIAGVSSFGWSGTNVHVVLEEGPAEIDGIAGSGPWPVAVSAETQEGLQRLAEAFAERLAVAEVAELPAISYTSTMRKTAHACRIAVAGSEPAEIARELRRRIAGGEGLGIVSQDDRLAAWERGEDVDWSVWFPQAMGVVDLPLYPFEGREYWIEEKATRRAERRDAAPTAPDDWFYTVELREKNLEARQASRFSGRASWILLGRSTELSREIVATLRSRGAEVLDGYAVQGDGRERKQRFAERLGQGANQGARTVVYFPEEQEPPALAAEALELVQAVVACEGAARLWFVTEAAVPALESFARVAGLEHPERVGGVITADAGSAEQVCEEIEADAGEDHVVLRGGHRWVPRLIRDKPAGGTTLRLREDRSYLVTGAFGAIGFDVAEWLIGAGARHLVLVGRRHPSTMGKPQWLARLDAWRAAGLDVRTCVCDVADEAQVNALLAEIDGGDAPLAGVMHAAAHVRFAAVQESTAEDVRDAFRAKVEGARVLDRCTRERGLDFFVLFGSVAATLGLRNGAMYAAANGALQKVVDERRVLGLPAVCVEWGWWESDHSGAQRELIENSGFQAMRPEAALAGLTALMEAGRSHGMVAAVDWRTLGPALALRGRAALVSEIREVQGPASGKEDVPVAAWVETLQLLTTAERRDRLVDLVGAEARAVFEMGPQDVLASDRGLFEMGMDSLMAVGLKCRLEEQTGLRLPDTLTLTYPTIDTLAEYLQNRLFGEDAATAPVSKQAEPDGNVAALAAMNDEETRAALEDELAAVQQTLAREAR